MTRRDILSLDGNIVDDETFERIEESEIVKSVENLGASGQYIGCNWWLVTLVTDDEIEIYTEG